MRQILGPVSITGCLLLTIACSSSGPTNSSPAGGSSATGGTIVSGGQMGSGSGSVAGGSALQGGTVSSGGNAPTGGATGTGGTIATGGTSGKGGVSGTGGTSANGGTSGDGGASGTGGVIATGGATLTGGIGGTGGTTATGGTQIVTAGTTATGGSTRTGGTSASGGIGSGGVASGGTSTSGGASSTGGTAIGGTTATGGTTPTGATASIISAVPLLDTSGNLVNAHGVGFIRVGNTYYMVGEQRSGKNDTYSGSTANGEDAFSGISMYSTTDFVNWAFVGTVVTPVPGTILYPPQCGERPKILYNASTSKYVIYIKMMTQTGSPSVYIGSFAVLTSSSISGPYALQGTLSLTGADDFQVFQDTDGSQYLVRSEGKLYKFSADGLSINTTPVKTGIQSGEGVSLYQAGSTYFWQSSQGSYWHCNDNSYSTATSLTGTWTSHGNFCPSGSKTWESQDTAVVTVAGTSGTTYIYVGDRWANGHLPASTLVMQPFTVSGSTESIPTYNPIWKLDVAAGTWSPVTPSGTTVNDNTTGTGPNQFTYSSGWTASSCSSCYNSDSHSSSTTGATATIGFTGTRILLYSAYDNSSGIMGVTLSDSSGTAVTPEVQVSLRYDAPATGNYLVYASPIVPNGSYVLKVRVTGLKDLYSSGTTCNIDRVLIQ
jgi:Glycosyl hydrolases family 43